MKYEVLSFCLVALALALFIGAPALAEEKGDTQTHEGKVVSVSGTKLIMSDAAGKEHTHTLADDAKVWVDNKAAKADDLKPGMRIRVSTPKDDLTKVVKIEALDKEKDFPKK